MCILSPKVAGSAVCCGQQNCSFTKVEYNTLSFFHSLWCVCVCVCTPPPPTVKHKVDEMQHEGGKKKTDESF